MGHSTGKPFEMGKLIWNVSCSFFFYSFSSFASQITILYYLNFIWLKYFTFISAELFCMTIRQAQFHGQRRNSRSWRGGNPQHMMGEQHPSLQSFPPCIKGGSLIRNESSEYENQLLREESTPQLWPVPTKLQTPACTCAARLLNFTCKVLRHCLHSQNAWPSTFLYLMSNRDIGNISSPSSLALLEQ